MMDTVPEIPVWRKVLNNILGHHSLMLGTVVFGIIVLAAPLPVACPHDPYAQDVTQPDDSSHLAR
ncbi:hypothetical protein P4S72_20730 [Vibrio sp. PP-XX7]